LGGFYKSVEVKGRGKKGAQKKKRKLYIKKRFCKRVGEKRKEKKV
jgi:hypothetical protein